MKTIEEKEMMERIKIVLSDEKYHYYDKFINILLESTEAFLYSPLTPLQKSDILADLKINLNNKNYDRCNYENK